MRSCAGALETFAVMQYAGEHRLARSDPLSHSCVDPLNSCGLACSTWLYRLQGLQASASLVDIFVFYQIGRRVLDLPACGSHVHVKCRSNISTCSSIGPLMSQVRTHA